MIVSCIANDGSALPASCRNTATGMVASAEFPLTIGRSYVVYAFTTFDGYSWLYVLDDDERAHPIWYPAALFLVEDPRIPTDWVFGYVRPAPEDDGYPVLSFPEWALDRHFYERLVDGDDEAQRVFKRRRATSEKH